MVGVAMTASAALPWQQASGYRVAPVDPAKPGKTGFTLLSPADTGVAFTNVLPDSRSMANANLMNGSGVAVGDYDGDGLADIYLCNLNGTNVLYKNLGNWKFKDVTAEAGVACVGQTSTGAVFADVNGDGLLDLIVTSMGGPHAMFINQGNGKFINTIQTCGITSKFGATSIALADINGDGALDLYICNYGVDSIFRSGGAPPIKYDKDGRPSVMGRYGKRIKFVGDMMFELGEPGALYLNDGKGNFTQLPWKGGTVFTDEHGKALTEEPWDQGLSVIFRDMNGDGAPDIYTCNDAFTPDRCWINDGKGHFRALPNRALRQTSYFSMGADFADIDRDGIDDLLVVDMQSRQHSLRMTQQGVMNPQEHLIGDLDGITQLRRNTLFHGRGDGTYAEVANFAGVASSDWTWSTMFIDVDLDGWEDFLISNGFERNVDDMDTKEKIAALGNKTVSAQRKATLLFPKLVTPNMAFRNKHDLSFEEVGKSWGFDSKEVSNGMAFGDFDNDGDLDVVVNCLNGPALLYRNDSAAPRLAVRLKGKTPNTQGIGAKLKVMGGPVTQTQEVMSGGRFLSGDDPIRVFAAGQATALDVEVTWRNGSQSLVKGVKPNSYLEVDETGAVPSPATAAKKESPLFVERPDLLEHLHHEDVFDDFARQPLLPHKLTQSGPGVAWFDFDGDGVDELIVGASRGAAPSIFKRDPAGKFVPMNPPLASSMVGQREQTTILGWTPKPGQRELLVGASSWVDGNTNGPAVFVFALQNGGWNSRLALPMADAVGPMALADVNGDGSLDLFVGGRAVPGRFPQAASSALFFNKGGALERSAANDGVFKNVGLVNGAIFTDLNGDGQPDLVLACEWGPVRVFLNNRGVFTEATKSLGLDKLTGWWTSVAAGDIDGDGRMDLIVGNWGLNTPYTASPTTPARLFHGDFTGQGGVDIIEAYDPPDLGKTAPFRNLTFISTGLPGLRAKVSSHQAYAASSVAELLGDKFATAQQLQATTLATTLLLNRGDHFEAVALPAEAQFAPVFGICIADFDGDGHEDVFLAQNFSATRGTEAVFNAGRGLLLRGGANGVLQPVRGEASGIKIYGDQRGAAVGDFDGDGRIDLVVSQNGNATKLLQNQQGKPGLRVRLAGPAGNPTGVGAQLWWKEGTPSGAVHEIQAGSGYWSQNSATQVISRGSDNATLVVRWPGGKTTASSIPTNTREAVIDSEGKITANP